MRLIPMIINDRFPGGFRLLVTNIMSNIAICVRNFGSNVIAFFVIAVRRSEIKMLELNIS